MRTRRRGRTSARRSRRPIATYTYTPRPERNGREQVQHLLVDRPDNGRDGHDARLRIGYDLLQRRRDGDGAASAGANAQSLDPNAPGDYVVPVTINVNDVDEPPGKLATPTVTQNTATPKTKLDVSWTALTTTQMAGKPAVNDYDVQYKKSSDDDWTDASFTGTTTSTTLTGLDEGTEYDVQVRAVNDEGDGAWSDSGEGNTQDKNVHAEFPDTTATRSIAENSAAGTNVGAAVTANDTENHTLYYSLNGTDKDEFDVGLNTGQITVKTGKVPNYEAKTSYSVTVEVSDRKDTNDNADTKIDDTIAVTINVTDVDEPPALRPSPWRPTPRRRRPRSTCRGRRPT